MPNRDITGATPRALCPGYPGWQLEGAWQHVPEMNGRPEVQTLDRIRLTGRPRDFDGWVFQKGCYRTLLFRMLKSDTRLEPFHGFLVLHHPYLRPRRRLVVVGSR